MLPEAPLPPLLPEGGVLMIVSPEEEGLVVDWA